MKKIVALCLSFILVFSFCCIGVSAEDEAVYTDYPVILVPGYSSSLLCRVDEETGEEIVVWKDLIAQIGEGAGGSVDVILKDFATYLLAGDVEPIAKRLGEGFNKIFGENACNPDGSSTYELYRALTSAEETNYANLIENFPDGTFQFESEIMADLAEKIGYENLYVFSGDFRLGAIYNADLLKDYIDDVISYENQKRAAAGKEAIDKVNLFAVSHGGQVSGTYLTLYGFEGKVNNAVLTVPALGGAGIAYDAFNEDIEFDEEGLFTFIQHGSIWEEDYDLFFRANQLGLLDELIEALLPYVMETIGYWGSLWDFIPLEHYEEIKAKHLDAEENAGLIAASDRMHYEIMAESGSNYYAKGFEKAQNSDTNIYILAGYDNQVITGMKASSDAIIHTSGATGATVAEFGKRFSDGYVQKLDTGFYQVSPSMTVDASTCYLPEHTWFIENYYHGMTAKDEYTYSLMQTLLLSDKSYDVNTLEGYSQFHATTNASHGVFAEFNSSKEGYVSSADTSLVVKNISAENKILVKAVTVSGLDIEFNFIPFVLAPGESKEITFDGEIPEVSLVNFEATVDYCMGTITPIGERVFDFTVMNGEAVEFDSENPYTDADFPKLIDGVISDSVNDVLTSVGVKDVVSSVYNVVYKIICYIATLVGYFQTL